MQITIFSFVLCAGERWGACRGMLAQHCKGAMGAEGKGGVELNSRSPENT